jgi:hypothetical protein
MTNALMQVILFLAGIKSSDDENRGKVTEKGETGMTPFFF